MTSSLTQTSGSPRGPVSRRGLLVLVLALLLLGAYLVVVPWRANSLLATARRAHARGDFSRSLELARRSLWWQPETLPAGLLACDAAHRLERHAELVELARRLPWRRDSAILTAHLHAARALLTHLDDPSAAEVIYRRIVELAPDDPAATEGLANLLGLTARRWEALPLLREMIRGDHFQAEHLTLMGAEGGAHPALDSWRRWIEERPDDPLANLAWAWHLRNERDLAGTEACLRRAIAARPELTEAHAQLGELLALAGRFPELVNWHRELPADADEFPQVWTTRALWSQHSGNPEGAIRCYAEALRRNPHLRDASHHLAQLLIVRGESDRAAPLLEWSAKLQELSAREAVLLHSVHTTLDPLERVSEQMESLGRYWEARGWSRIAERLDSRAAWPRTMAARLDRLLAENPPWASLDRTPFKDFSLKQYALPAWPPQTIRRVDSPALASVQAGIQFVEAAQTAGIDFRYFNSADFQTPGQLMYEFTGGGVAALDFDGDYWPDLYFTQGCPWPPQADNTRYLDQLYRNRGDGRFDDVTAQTGIREQSFSQGVAAGDVDSDGFCDLFVANIGANRLWINQGDGTFREEPLVGDRALWTTSAAIADLNGDAFPEIYAANYLQAADLFERMCAHKDGVPRMCAPFDFPGSPDELYLNSGDGRFREAASECGIVDLNGKGLGVVAADFEGNGRIGLFVANDLVENFFWSNQTAGQTPPRFEEQALVRGLAYGADGRAQGCMGIAAGDATQDGRIDLLVTNFMQEPNAFYVQQDGGLFVDEIDRAGLREPSLLPLGFGTQFLDADLDGRLDLIVTNGHIDDHRAYGRPYHMPPQFFQNVGQGRFRELKGAAAGNFFAESYLGRGLARLDWNRDGAEDAVISHLDSPAALLTNSTLHRGGFLALRLRGVRSERYAVGTRLTLDLPDHKLTRHVTAGDGYQASNESLIIFGIGDDDLATAELTIHWPSGQVDRIRNLERNVDAVVIEGQGRLWTLSRE